MAVISPEIVPCVPSPRLQFQLHSHWYHSGLMFGCSALTKDFKEIKFPRKTGAGFYWIAAVWVWVLHITVMLTPGL